MRWPECLSPRRWFDWLMEQAGLLLVLGGVSLHGYARISGRDRRTVRRWRGWLLRRDHTFAFALRSRWPEPGRTTDSVSFWRRVIEELSLPQVMARLDRDLAAA